MPDYAVYTPDGEKVTIEGASGIEMSGPDGSLVLVDKNGRAGAIFARREWAYVIRENQTCRCGRCRD